MNYMLMPIKKLYRIIEGRSERREFWMFILLNVLITVAVIAIAAAVGGASMLDLNGVGAAAFGAGAGLLLIVFVPLYFWYLLASVAIVAVSIRRLHDANLTGWIYLGLLIGLVIPIVNFLVFLVYIVLMALPGTDGPNKYGEDPKNPTSADVFA